MTRIIAGSAGGRRLTTPKGDKTRPTSDRVREALFSAIESWGGALEGLAFLDLYAGSGAIGLEAVSRGATRALLVEQNQRTASVARDNARALGMDRAQVRAANVATVLGGSPEAPFDPFDVVFADPPYSVDTVRVEEDLAALVVHGWLAHECLVVVERSTRSRAPVWPVGLVEGRSRRYGESTLWYGHAALDLAEPKEDI